MNNTENRHITKETLESAKDYFLPLPMIELLSNQQATIQGAKGIVEYTDELIRVNLLNMEVRIYGKKLTIGNLSQDGMEIYGVIERLEYQ